MPSIMGRRKKAKCRGGPPAKHAKIVSWDRTIICLPSCYPEYCKSVSGIAIPRKKRSLLSAHGLIGKLHLESDWSQEDVFAEIRSVFADAMFNDSEFPFRVMLLTGSGTKSLMVPCWGGQVPWGHVTTQD